MVELYPGNNAFPVQPMSPLQRLGASAASEGLSNPNTTPAQQSQAAGGLYSGQTPLANLPKSNSDGLSDPNSLGAQALQALTGTQGSPLGLLGNFIMQNGGNALMQQVGSALAPSGQYGPFQPQSSVMSALNPFSSNSVSNTAPIWMGPQTADVVGPQMADAAAAETPSFFSSLLAMLGL